MVTDPNSLAPIAAHWAKAHGGEKGLTMGRFEPRYLRQQRIYAAFDGTRPIAFVSFHQRTEQWTLDLMRHLADVPTGTMHALITTAIEDAHSKGLKTLSLAAVLAPPPHLPFASKAAARATGLRRFKSAFAPRWSPRYICAPSRLSLIVTAASLCWAIHNPKPLRNQIDAPTTTRGTNPPQGLDENFSFEPSRPPCEALPS